MVWIELTNAFHFFVLASTVGGNIVRIVPFKCLLSFLSFVLPLFVFFVPLGVAPKDTYGITSRKGLSSECES